MRSRKKLDNLILYLRDRPSADVRATYEALRNDLSETLADLAADILLHQEACERLLDELPDEYFDEPELAETIRALDPPFWSLVVEDFQRLAVWLPRQRLARFGESDAIRAFRDRLVEAMRPALVELERYGVVRGSTSILDEDYWTVETLYDLALRYDAFALALYRSIEGRMRHDLEALDGMRQANDAANLA